MIDPAAVDWVFLTRIATIYTQVKSEGRLACVVLPLPPDAYHWGKAARYAPRMWSIRMNCNQPPSEFERTFFHELGHLVSEHPPQRADGDTGGVGLDNVDSLTDADWRETMRAHLHMIEAEADELGAAMQAEFERRHGSLLALALR